VFFSQISVPALSERSLLLVLHKDLLQASSIEIFAVSFDAIAQDVKFYRSTLRCSAKGPLGRFCHDGNHLYFMLDSG